MPIICGYELREALEDEREVRSAREIIDDMESEVEDGIDDLIWVAQHSGWDKV